MERCFYDLTSYESIIYGIYYDYESDYKGDYSLSVAIEDVEGEHIILIQNHENYKVFHVDTTQEQGILKTWSKIWEQEEFGALKRAYTYDYEKYYPNGEIEIHISIK